MGKGITYDKSLEYVNHILAGEGSICPYCGCDDVEGNGRTEWGVGVIENQMVCLSCKSKWWERYELAGINPDESLISYKEIDNG